MAFIIFYCHNYDCFHCFVLFFKDINGIERQARSFRLVAFMWQSIFFAAKNNLLILSSTSHNNLIFIPHPDYIQRLFRSVLASLYYEFTEILSQLQSSIAHHLTYQNSQKKRLILSIIRDDIMQ